MHLLYPTGWHRRTPSYRGGEITKRFDHALSLKFEKINLVIYLQVKPIRQHLQGVINHGGNEFSVYRTYENISGGANLAIYCFLSSVEELIKNRRDAGLPVPTTLFHQARS